MTCRPASRTPSTTCSTASAASATLEVHYRQMMSREQALLARRLRAAGRRRGLDRGRLASRAPPVPVAAVPPRRRGRRPRKVDGRDGGRPCRRGCRRLRRQARTQLPDSSFDVVLYRLVLHHLAYQGPLSPCFSEAARLLRPGGALVAIEPGLWHPVGLGLALANRAGAATRGARHARRHPAVAAPAGRSSRAPRALCPELHAVTYTWRRLPPVVQRSLQPLDALGSRPRAAVFGHTLMLIARRRPS